MASKLPAWLVKLWPGLANGGQANYDLGCRFLSQGEVQDAVLRFKLAVWFEPNFADAWGKLGTAYSQYKQPEKAREAWQQALKLNPEQADARAGLS